MTTNFSKVQFSLTRLVSLWTDQMAGVKVDWLTGVRV